MSTKKEEEVNKEREEGSELKAVGDSPIEIGMQIHDVLQQTYILLPTLCDVHVGKPKKKQHCSVCGTMLDNIEGIPEDTPKRWRVCCFCHDVWLWINGILTDDNYLIEMAEYELKHNRNKYGRRLEEVFSL